MKKRLTPLIVLLIVVGLMIVPTMARSQGLHGQAGKSNVYHLYFYQYDPDTGEDIESGAWGKIKYNRKKLDLVFNGHGLEPGMEYLLIYYNPLEEELICFGSGVADEYGNVHIKGSVEDASYLPAMNDENDYGGYALVRSLDVISCEEGIDPDLWDPASYLFEKDRYFIFEDINAGIGGNDIAD